MHKTMAEQADKNDSIELVAECLCKAHRFTAAVPRSALPLSASYCHCDSCRWLTGALYSTYVPWPGSYEAIRASSLRRYKFSESITALSCGVCSGNLFAETAADSDKPSYGVVTGALTNLAEPDLLKISHHIFVGDTKDGGVTPWLCDANPDGTRPQLWSTHRGQSEEYSSTDHTHWPLPSTDASPPEETPVRCHCGGVDLVLRNPIPVFAGQDRASLPGFVDPESNKLLGLFDCCDSCRMSSGVDIFHWTFVLPEHLAFPSPNKTESSKSSSLPPSSFPKSSIELKTAISAPSETRDPRWGTLTFYSSSPDVQRYFCSRCSASVFYAADGRPEVLDLAIGLLHSENGSRAEDLVSWEFGAKMTWRQDAVGGWREGLVQSVEGAADRLRKGRGLPKNWRRIQKEEKEAATKQ
ncbi:Mss4-like protein [Xylaria arbuscula]|nr:Mss4-like protein [Xylaria arbuscula]